MCGIIGLQERNGKAVSHVLDGLATMEYRGYDSTGVAYQNSKGLHVVRSVGKVRSLRAALGKPSSIASDVAVGHTRWATHGKPLLRNAHPHQDCAGNLAVVHNGIIQNADDLRSELAQKGHKFRSDTDTEVLAHLLEDALKKEPDPLIALGNSLRSVRGSLAAVYIISKSGKSVLMAARRGGPPLLVGLGPGGPIAASDPLALAGRVAKAASIPDSSCFRLDPDKITGRGLNGGLMKLQLEMMPLATKPPERGDFPHFMLKEIHDQPEMCKRILKNTGKRLKEIWPKIMPRPHQVLFLGCGTSWHACLLGRIFFEELAGIPARVEYASEFRSQSLPPQVGTLAIALSQSGETADTLAAADLCYKQGIRLLGLVNVPGSAITRICDAVLPLDAGPEIGVASTKAFTSQVLLLLLLALELSNPRKFKDIKKDLKKLPEFLNELLQMDSIIHAQAGTMAEKAQCLYLGRGPDYPIALEGALKLKEISYIHAEGIPAGEVKHGPIALIEEDMPVVVVANEGTLFDRTIGNVQEVLARGGKVLTVGSAASSRWPKKIHSHIRIPKTHPFVAALLSSLPLQLLAYHTAVILGRDVDQPRNLAKSVTVE